MRVVSLTQCNTIDLLMSYVSIIHYFLSLSRIPLYSHTILCLLIQNVVDIGLFPVLSDHDYSFYEHSNVDFCVDVFLVLLGEYLKMGLRVV